MQKEIVMCKQRLTQTEKVCSETPGILQWMEKTDTYLQNYLPTEYYAEIHYALAAAFKDGPTKCRLDQVEYSMKKVSEFMDKMK